MKNQIFNSFCRWLEKESGGESSGKFLGFEDRLKIYEKKLTDDGCSRKQARKNIRIIKDIFFKIDIAKWNKFYSGDPAKLHQSPNTFLAKTAEGMPIGNALDVGMGNGRNAIFLAQNGWTTTGLEASETALQIALKQAERKNVRLEGILTDYEKFDFGRNRWDLIIMMYVPVREIAAQAVESLSSRGSLIIESYLAEGSDKAIGNKVIYKKDELPEIFNSLNTYLYQETEDLSDFESGKTSIVRFHAGKLKA